LVGVVGSDSDEVSHLSASGVLVRLITSSLHLGVLVVFFKNQPLLVISIVHVGTHSPATVAPIAVITSWVIVADTVECLLLAKSKQLACQDGMSTFESTRGSKSPAGTARGLVLDRGHSVLGPPVHPIRHVNEANLGCDGGVTERGGEGVGWLSTQVELLVALLV